MSLPLRRHRHQDHRDAQQEGQLRRLPPNRSRAINFGPGHGFLHHPIFFPVGDDDLYALDASGFMMLSLKPMWPPRLEDDENNYYHHGGEEWTWAHLPRPPFNTMDVASYLSGAMLQGA